MTDKLVATRIRSTRGAQQGVKDTLEILKLTKKHRAVVLNDTKQNRGMLQKVKDFITYAEVTEDTLDDLDEQRSTSSGKDHVYRLTPPTGGYEAKGVKVNYSAGGANGYRGDDMDDLVQRML